MRAEKPGGGYDRNTWSDKAIGKVLEHVHDDPGRRGLATTPDEYSWSATH